jgi:hypothetical protein
LTSSSSPARGAPEEPSARRERPQLRAVEFGRSAAAPVILAFTTIAALAGAVLALLPTLGRRRPVGRLGVRPTDDAGGDREATTDPLAP